MKIVPQTRLQQETLLRRMARQLHVSISLERSGEIDWTACLNAIADASEDRPVLGLPLNDLLDLAKAWDIQIHRCHLDPEYGGLYDDEEKRIYLAVDMTMDHTRGTFAHELGHAFYHHPCSSPDNERLADEFAAQLLVSAEIYQLVTLDSPDAFTLRRRLRISTHYIRVFESLYAEDRLTTSLDEELATARSRRVFDQVRNMRPRRPLDNVREAN